MRVLHWDIDIALLLEPLKHREEGLQAQQDFYFTSSQRVPAGPDWSHGQTKHRHWSGPLLFRAGKTDIPCVGHFSTQQDADWQQLSSIILEVSQEKWETHKCSIHRAIQAMKVVHVWENASWDPWILSSFSLLSLALETTRKLTRK